MLVFAGIGYSQAIITNGTGIYLGVNPTGNLNVPDGTGGITLTPTNSGAIGLYFATTDGESTAPGCLCEGWGVGVNGTTVGYANVDAGGVSNLTVDSFVTTASTANSLVHLTSLPLVTVRHEFGPSSSSSLMQVVVTITNGTAGTLTNVRYDRTMDWDIPPTTFDEFVTIQGWPATNLVATSNNGFATPNPYTPDLGLIGGAGAVLNGNFTDAGSADHGARFIFGFGSLAPGATQTFTIFYGAATTESGALAALGAVGAEVYSFGQPNGGQTSGAPNTFIFAFKGVGGTPVPPTVPEPSSILLLGSGLAGLAVWMKKRVK
jgi:type IV pilus assembly protein PilY1